jgi:hypothetical protein
MQRMEQLVMFLKPAMVFQKIVLLMSLSRIHQLFAEQELVFVMLQKHAQETASFALAMVSSQQELHAYRELTELMGPVVM